MSEITEIEIRRRLYELANIEFDKDENVYLPLTNELMKKIKDENMYIECYATSLYYGDSPYKSVYKLLPSKGIITIKECRWVDYYELCFVPYGKKNNLLTSKKILLNRGDLHIYDSYKEAVKKFNEKVDMYVENFRREADSIITATETIKNLRISENKND